MEPSTSTNIIDSWTTCHSFIQKHTNGSPQLSRYIPPSQWDQKDFNKYCFLHRNITNDPSRYSTLAPGTALFQHWMADFEQNKTKSTSWDPWNEFPTWEIMNQYPDISDDRELFLDDGNISIAARDYYTLWYTTKISAPEKNTLVDQDTMVSSDQSKSARDDRRLKWKRGHLTLHAVNYQPLVYYGGELLHPYSTFHDRRNEDVNVGGMFLRRHYDLGIWRDDKDSSLEILVLPPPIVGKPTVDNDSISRNKDSSRFDWHLNGKTNSERYLNHHAKKQYGKSNRRRNEPQGQGGDHDLAQSGAVMQCTLGWDWIQPTPDRNTGIWEKVQVKWIFGDVRLHDVRVKLLEVSVRTVNEEGQFKNRDDGFNERGLPLGEDVLVSALLDLSVTVTHHGISPIVGDFHYQIKRYTNPDLTTEEPIAYDDTATLASGAFENITIGHSVAEYHLGQILLSHAKLWWPHSFGAQPLYVVNVVFRSLNDDESESIHESQTESTFGVRTISSYTHPQTKSLTLEVNGHSIFLVGGNWITTDQFLRYSTSRERYLSELLLLKNIGFNAIRVWGGGITESAHFYHAADALGFVVYQEYWMSGDNNGKEAGSYDWPLDHEAYLLNAQDVVIRLRNHPSLVLYGGGNELFPIPPETKTTDFGLGTSPPQDMDDNIRAYIARLDGSRPYVSSSVTDVGDVFDPTRSLGPKDGPYGILNEKLFFDVNPGFTTPLLREDEVRNNASPSDDVDIDSPGRSIGFQTEIGSVSHPELESLRRFLTPDAMNSVPVCGVIDERSESVHSEWRYFKYLPFTEASFDSTGVDHICQFQFPKINNNTSTHDMGVIEDYTWSAQLAQYFQYKSLFEGYSSRMFQRNSAVFFWKSSSPTPTFRGALYDWYLETNGGYWGARSGLGDGKSMRVLLNLLDWSIHIVNASPVAVTAISVHWRAYSLDGKLVGSGSIAISHPQIDAKSVTKIEDQIPWVRLHGASVANDFQLQDVLYYRFDMPYEESKHGRFSSPNSPNTRMTVTNSYYLTDPDENHSINRQTRFSLLGAFRKVFPKFSVDASCKGKGSLNGGIKCALKNANSKLAIMIKLSLIRNSSQVARESKDLRILPTYFSNNYITLIPDEFFDVELLSIDVEKTQCSNGYITELDTPESYLLVSIDGWNIRQGSVKIACNL